MLYCEICDREMRWNVDVNEDYDLEVLVCHDCRGFVEGGHSKRVGKPEDLLRGWLWGNDIDLEH